MGIFDHIGQFGGRTAVITDDDRAISYQQLTTLGDDLADRLPEHCLILQVCRNDLASLAAYVGFQRAGIVTMLVNSKSETSTLRTLIEAFRPAYLFLPDEQAAALGVGTPIDELEAYRLVATNLDVDYPIHDGLALLLGTSGSTGSPDYVRLSATNLSANTQSIIDYLGVDSDDRAITTMPMSYSYGLSIINTHLSKGACVITTEKTLMERRFWALLHDSGATNFGGVPFIYQMLQRLKFPQMELPSLRYITQAGGRLDPDLCRNFATACGAKGVDFLVMYGQTEATARIAYVPADQAIAKAGSIGIAIPGGRIWLADNEGKPISDHDTDGEIVFEGDNVSLGYACNRHGLGEPDQNNGILFTGDIAHRDSDGFHYIRGRKSRFLKIFGNRVSLDQLEQLLHDQGVEAVCGGSDDGLVIYSTAAEHESSIRKILAKQTTLNRQGYKICLIDSIPRNDAGKVRYAALPMD